MTITRRGRGVLAVGVVAVVVVVAAVVLFDRGDDDGGDSPAARRKKATVTEANNGGEVTVAPGKPFILDLKGSPDAPWGLPEASSPDLARVQTSQDLDGSAAATFTAVEATPRVIVTAQRVPRCRTASPPCEQPVERFEVTIRVME